MTVELRRRPRYGEIMKYLHIFFQTGLLLIAMYCTITAINEFRAGELNEGLASMAVVVGTGVYQLISIYILLLRRKHHDNRT